MGSGRFLFGGLSIAVALILAACGGGSDDGAATSTTERTLERPASRSEADASDAPAAGVSYVAQAKGAQLQVFASPAPREPTDALDNPNENGAPLVFLVEQNQGEWLEVLLPVRPNGSTGWIRAADVTIAQNPYRVDIMLAQHRLVVRKGEEVITDEPIGVGTASTPTPGGRYFLKELLEPPDPNGPYGRYAYGLSGFSNVLDEFNGGDGVIGIHGTNDPSTIGRDVSHGCIRMTNEAISALVPVLPLGTPVHITA